MVVVVVAAAVVILVVVVVVVVAVLCNFLFSVRCPKDYYYFYFCYSVVPYCNSRNELLICSVYCRHR